MVRTVPKEPQPWLEPHTACICKPVVIPPARDARQLAADMKVWLASVRSSSGPRQCSLTVSEVAVVLVAIAEHPQGTIGAGERADALLAWVKGVSP